MTTERVCWSVLGQAALVGIPSPDASLLGAWKYQVRPRYSERQAWKQQAVWVMALGCLFVVAKLQRRGLKYFSHRACDQCRESSRTWCIGALPSERWMQLSGWVYALCCPAVLYHRQHGYWRWSKLLKWASLWNCHSSEDKSWLKAGFLNAVEKNHCEIKCRKIYVSSVSLCLRQMWGKSTTQLLGWGDQLSYEHSKCSRMTENCVLKLNNLQWASSRPTVPWKWGLKRRLTES